MRARSLMVLATALPLLLAGCGSGSDKQSVATGDGTDNSKVLVVLADDLKL